MREPGVAPAAGRIPTKNPNRDPIVHENHVRPMSRILSIIPLMEITALDMALSSRLLSIVHIISPIP